MKTYLIVGLGNHGATYANTWHNMGFIAIDMLCEELNLEWKKKPLVNYKLAQGNVGNDKILLLKPYTYMNRSGEAVLSIMRKHNVKTENIVVLVDDLYIDKGKIRIGLGGGNGGHNGIRSINELTSAKDYTKIKIGIKPTKEVHTLSNYVLSRIGAEDKGLIGQSCTQVTECVKMIIAGEKLDKLQAKFNVKNEA